MNRSVQGRDMRPLGEKPYFLRMAILLCLLAGAAGVAGVIAPGGNKALAICCVMLLAVGILVWKASDAAEEERGRATAAQEQAREQEAARVREAESAAQAVSVAKAASAVKKESPTTLESSKKDYAESDGPTSKQNVAEPPAAKAAPQKPSRSWWGYYDIELMHDGGLVVDHHPQDRMSPDEPERFVFAPDELAEVSRADFARRFADWIPSPEQVAELDAWLAQTGVTFASATSARMKKKLWLRGVEAARVAQQEAEERKAAERAALPAVRVTHVGEREMDTLKVIRQFGEMSLAEADELMKHRPFVVHVRDVDRFVRTMEALGNTVRVE